MVRGSPSMCMRQQDAPALATRPASSGSNRNAETSFTIRAPAWRAASATASLVVSIETRATPFTASRSTTGTTRSSSTSAGTDWAPGRVDSPPTSRISAPSAASSSPWRIAASGSRYRPPSENESGVTLTTPITMGREPFMGSRLRDVQHADGVGAGSESMVLTPEAGGPRSRALENIEVPGHARLLGGLQLDHARRSELVLSRQPDDRLAPRPAAVLRRVERVPLLAAAAKVVGEAAVRHVEVQEARL